MGRSRELAELASAYDGGSLGFRNRIINGDMRIDQRNAGASVTVTNDSTYCVDRFAGHRGGVVSNYTLQQSSTAPVGFSKSLLVTMGTGVTITATSYAMLSQRIEGYNVADLGLGTTNAVPFTLSFWVRSSVVGTFGVSFRNNSATATYCATYAINSANTWEYKTVAIPAITAGTWTTDNTAGVMVAWDLGAGVDYSAAANQLTANGNNYFGVLGTTKLAATTGATFYITGVQLEAGSTATSFDYRPYGTELALCQRYYEVFMQGFAGTLTSGHAAGIATPFAVVKRATPTVGQVASLNASGFGAAVGAYFVTANYGVATYHTATTTGNCSWVDQTYATAEL